MHGLAAISAVMCLIGLGAATFAPDQPSVNIGFLILCLGICGAVAWLFATVILFASNFIG